jgi:hypothetical protein
LICLNNQGHHISIYDFNFIAASNKYKILRVSSTKRRPLSKN